MGGLASMRTKVWRAPGARLDADQPEGRCRRSGWQCLKFQGLQAYGWAAGSLEAWSSSGSGDGNSDEAGARRLQPAHLLQVAVQTETANRQRADQDRVEIGRTACRERGCQSV